MTSASPEQAASADRMPRFQAMSVGQLLDATLRLYVRHFPLLAGITAVAYVPYYFLLILVLLLAEAGSPGMVTFVASLMTGLGLLVMFFVLSPLSIAATLIAVSERYLQRPVSILSAFRLALQRFLNVFLAYLLLGVILGAVFVVFFLVVLAGTVFASFLGVAMGGPGGGIVAFLFVFLAMMAMLAALVAVFVIFSMVVPAVLLEGLNAIEAMRRSIELTSGHRIKIFAVFFVLYLVIIVVNLALMAAVVAVYGLDAVENSVLSQVVQLLANLISTPLLYTSIVFLYYDLRIRKEAFDLDYLSQSLEIMEGKTPAAPSGPAAQAGEQPAPTPQHPARPGPPEL